MMIPTANLGTTTWRGKGKLRLLLKSFKKFEREGQKSIAYIESASTHFGSKVCSANPEVSLVLISDELHH